MFKIVFGLVRVRKHCFDGGTSAGTNEGTQTNTSHI